MSCDSSMRCDLELTLEVLRTYRAHMHAFMVSSELCVLWAVCSQADFAEQLFSWQDGLFGNTDGRLRLEGCPAPQPHFLWPGPM